MKLFGIKLVYWGHGKDLLDKKSLIKNAAYACEHWVCDAIVLYAEHLRKEVRQRFHYKVFVANNTLNFAAESLGSGVRRDVLAKYGIRSRKNIICIGRMEKRKRIDDLVKAYRALECDKWGLILVGPDIDGSLRGIEGVHIYKLGPVYGEERLQLLAASDVFCLPGHIGLSIVDAFHCALPIVTEAVEHAPEIMYLKEGVNGFIVPEGDTAQLADKLRLLLEDDKLRTAFSRAAKMEIETTGHIDRLCQGFGDALAFACGDREVDSRAHFPLGLS
jgi:glycosyltransferase involved in cell wall biosynthesis